MFIIYAYNLYVQSICIIYMYTYNNTVLFVCQYIEYIFANSNQKFTTYNILIIYTCILYV